MVGPTSSTDPADRSPAPGREWTRFAKAPTGYLHLGHVANGARVLLRIEDHDRERSRAAYDAALLGDLAWLSNRSTTSVGPVACSISAIAGPVDSLLADVLGLGEPVTAAPSQAPSESASKQRIRER